MQRKLYHALVQLFSERSPGKRSGPRQTTLKLLSLALTGETSAEQQSVQYEDTFTQTLIVDVLLILIFIILFTLLKRLFPAIYMPLVNTSKNKDWVSDIVHIPLATFAQRGNWNLFLAVFQQQIISLFLMLTPFALVILAPVYLLGSSQSVIPRTFWARLQITMVGDGSVFSLVPVAVCVIMVLILMRGYREFQILYLYYKQLIARRAAPQNFTILLDNIPAELQFEKTLLDTLEECYPAGQVVKVLPIPINNVSLYWKDWHLRRHMRNEQRTARHIYRLRALQQEAALLERQTGRAVHKQQLQNAANELFYWKGRYRAYVQKARRYKNKIIKMIDQEQIDLQHLRTIDQLYPPFPQVVTSFKFIDQAEDSQRNTVRTGREEARVQARERFYAERDAARNERRMENRPIGSACFVIFNSQKEASMAAASCLFADNTEPTLQPAPHPEEVLWHNIGAQKQEQFWYGMLFWIIMLVLFAGYFIPQTLILNYFSAEANQWFKSFYFGLCQHSHENPTCKMATLNGESLETLGSFGCYVCYLGSSLLITSLPTVVSAIFFSLLPMIIDLLLFIPRFKTRSQRYYTKYICLVAFLIMIQGFLSVILGAAYDDNGVLNFAVFLDMSVSEVFGRIGANISQQSFIFMNYALTKYFLFAVFGTMRFGDFSLTVLQRIFMKDTVKKVRIHRYKNKNQVTNLAYMGHLTMIGLMYSVVSPVVLLIVLICLLSIAFATRYNALFAYQVRPDQDLSQNKDVFVQVIQSVFIGTLLMIFGLISYVSVALPTYAAVSLSVLAGTVVLVVINKIQIDKKFKRSLEQLKMGAYENSSLYLNPFMDALRIEQVSYTRRTSFIYEEFRCAVANRESLENYNLTKEDVDNVATYYTHPAIACAAVYPGDQDDWWTA